MTNRKKIQTKRPWRSQVVWTVITVAILAVLWLAVERRVNSELQKVSVDIVDLKGKKNLLSEKAVLKKCRKYLGYDLSISTVGELDMRGLESMLASDKRVKNAEVFIDNKNVLHIGILQKQPIVRVKGESGTAYYLDEDGGAIPVVKGATVRVPIATGDIGKYTAGKIFGDKPNHLQDLYRISKEICKDEFLASLIEQINVDSRGEFTLVPKVGKQQLVFGKAEQIEERFEKLKIFYKEGMPKVGWRKYDKLALNWDGQVVGVKSKK